MFPHEKRQIFFWMCILQLFLVSFSYLTAQFIVSLLFCKISLYNNCVQNFSQLHKKNPHISLRHFFVPLANLVQVNCHQILHKRSKIQRMGSLKLKLKQRKIRSAIFIENQNIRNIIQSINFHPQTPSRETLQSKRRNLMPFCVNCRATISCYRKKRNDKKSCLK